MDTQFVNKVAESGIITLDLETFFSKQEVAVFDLKDYLFMGLILKEKDFREALKNLDISQYAGKAVAITCTADAVIPMWAYMLVASCVQPVAAAIFFGNEKAFEEAALLKNIEAVNTDEYYGQRVVIKGCGEKPIPESAYIKITEKLRPVVKSIMYGEPCSTVPVYKQPKDVV
jgi:Protein of unknown function (DUF2480)